MVNINHIHEDYLWCRDVQHSWEPYDANISRNKVMRRNEVHQTLVCTRCGTHRTRVLTTAGELVRNSYSYPDGYLIKDQGPMTAADRGMIRLINLKKHHGEIE